MAQIYNDIYLLGAIFEWSDQLHDKQNWTKWSENWTKLSSFQMVVTIIRVKIHQALLSQFPLLAYYNIMLLLESDLPKYLSKQTIRDLKDWRASMYHLLTRFKCHKPFGSPCVIFTWLTLTLSPPSASVPSASSRRQASSIWSGNCGAEADTIQISWKRLIQNRFELYEATVGARILNALGFWMGQSCLNDKWFGFWMPFKIRTFLNGKKRWPPCSNKLVQRIEIQKISLLNLFQSNLIWH